MVVGLGFIQAHFASTAVAAPGTLFAEVIVTTVLGASYADVRGFLFANATGKGHDNGYFPFFFLTGAATGCLEIFSRQRCAS